MSDKKRSNQPIQSKSEAAQEVQKKQYYLCSYQSEKFGWRKGFIEHTPGEEAIVYDFEFACNMLKGHPLNGNGIWLHAGECEINDSKVKDIEKTEYRLVVGKDGKNELRRPSAYPTRPKHIPGNFNAPFKRHKGHSYRPPSRPIALRRSSKVTSVHFKENVCVQSSSKSQLKNVPSQSTSTLSNTEKVVLRENEDVCAQFRSSESNTTSSA